MTKKIKFFVGGVASISLIVGSVFAYQAVTRQEMVPKDSQLSIDWFNPANSSQNQPGGVELYAGLASVEHSSNRQISPHEFNATAGYQHLADPEADLGKLLAELDGTNPQWADLDLSAQTTDSFLFNFGSIVEAYQGPLANSGPPAAQASSNFGYEPFSTVGGGGSEGGGAPTVSSNGEPPVDKDPATDSDGEPGPFAEDSKTQQAPVPVPEPSTWLLVGLGLVGIAWFRRTGTR